jgi:hypothetical protein
MNQRDQGVFMRMELTTPAARLDLERLLGLPGGQRTETIVDWLLGGNLLRKALAEEIAIRDKPGTAKLLVQKALAPRVTNSRRVQLLAAVARLGLEVDVSQWFDLMACSRRFGPDVQAQIAGVLRNCRPGAGEHVSAI